MRRRYQPVSIDTFADVMTLRDIAAVLGKCPRYCERLVTLQNALGEPCLPPSIPGMGHRYLKANVARWLRSGIPGRREKESRVKAVAA